ncbi:MAG: hypothetical protein AAF821_24810 [Cyanobacteria bacterium P01_D01_bin.156]
MRLSLSALSIAIVVPFLGLATFSDFATADRGSGRLTNEMADRGSGRLDSNQPQQASYDTVAYRGSGRINQDEAYRGSGRLSA